MSRPTRLTVESRAAKDFPRTDLAEILAVLDQYGVETYESEIHRVHMAVLKLSEGRKDELERAIPQAKADYRDVLAYAEFPAEMALGTDKSNAGAVEQARHTDEKQYREWLDNV